MEMPLILPLGSPLADLPAAGGKGANLARLVQAGFPVPDGFIITTAAYQAYLEVNELENYIRDITAALPADDPAALEDAAHAIRTRFAHGALPTALADSLCEAYTARELACVAVAVRSSATAEDLPELSFAGQQDTFLNVVGEEGLLRAVVDCWSSLWTARAIGYRSRNGVPHAGLAIAVIVQSMVQSEAAGVLFTANPLSGRRVESVIDAAFGLGEALVSGQVEPDRYVVETATGRILSRALGAKALSIRPAEGGGTLRRVESDQDRQALPDAAIVELVALGRQVAERFGSPQDIEWAWAGEKIWLLQARPITSLYPLVADVPADPLHVFVSFGAIQGVLGALTPLGLDVLRELAAVVAGVLGYRVTYQTQGVFFEAGERIFLDFSGMFRNATFRPLTRVIPSVIEPGVGRALTPLQDDPRLAPLGHGLSRRRLRYVLPVAARIARRLVVNLARPEHGRRRTQQLIEQTLAEFRERAAGVTSLAGVRVLITEGLQIFPRRLLVSVIPSFMGGMAAQFQLIYRLGPYLPGGQPAVLEMTRGLPHNVTTEMDLALWETAQAIRSDSAARAHFAAAGAPELAASYAAGRLPAVAQTAIASFLERYGMRGIGEIDLGRPRWREDPTPIMQTLLSYAEIEDADRSPAVVFARGAAGAEAAIAQATSTVRLLPGGWWKAHLVRWAARRMRALAGLRESPKFFAIRLMGILRERLLACGGELSAAGVLARADDIFFLHLSELEELGRRQAASGSTTEAIPSYADRVAERRQRYAREMARRQVPLVLLSDGQTIYPSALAAPSSDGRTITGTPVSPGVAEGRVRVVLDPHTVKLQHGEILVCPGTDPAWTPLFLAASALVMEVGGLMTHGSVVAREYGLPAVVGVEQATTRLRTGQRVRVDGTQGLIVLLDEAVE